jgi:hypothetical protein
MIRRGGSAGARNNRYRSAIDRDEVPPTIMPKTNKRVILLLTVHAGPFNTSATIRSTRSASSYDFVARYALTARVSTATAFAVAPP